MIVAPLSIPERRELVAWILALLDEAGGKKKKLAKAEKPALRSKGPSMTWLADEFIGRTPTPKAYIHTGESGVWHDVIRAMEGQ